MLPDGEMCKAEVYDELHFIDQGNNCEAVLCPSCGRQFAIDFFTENDPGMTWWFEVTDAISNSGSIREVQTRMPCCGASVPFTSLEFDWPAGFAHFALSIWNPNVADKLLTIEQMSKLENVLGCKLTDTSALLVIVLREMEMKPEELKVKVEELHTLIVEKLAELEEDPKWGEAEEPE